MPQSIRIQAGEIELAATLNDTPSALAIRDALPIEAVGNTWGEEIYAAIDVDQHLSDDARDVMEVGELAYWPPGKALCIFFGRTPASGPDGAPRAASEVNPIGRVDGNAKALAQFVDGQTVKVAPA